MALSYVPKRRPYGRRGVGFMGLLGLGERPPARIPGVRQHAVEIRPERCGQCQSRAVFEDRVEPRRIYCYACGWDVWIVAPEGIGARLG